MSIHSKWRRGFIICSLGIGIMATAAGDDKVCPSPPIDLKHPPAPWAITLRSPYPDPTASFTIVKFMRDFGTIHCQYGKLKEQGFVLTRRGVIPKVPIPEPPWYSCGIGIEVYCCKESIAECTFIPI